MSLTLKSTLTEHRYTYICDFVLQTTRFIFWNIAVEWVTGLLSGKVTVASRVLSFRVIDLSEEFKNLRGNELQMKMASHTLAPCRKTKPIILCSCLTDSSCCMLQRALKPIHLSHPSVCDIAEPGEINRNLEILSNLQPFLQIFFNVLFYYMLCIMLRFLLWFLINVWRFFCLSGLSLLIWFWVNLLPVQAREKTRSSRSRWNMHPGNGEYNISPGRHPGGILTHCTLSTLDACGVTLSLWLSPGTDNIEQISFLHLWTNSFSHSPVSMTTGEGRRIKGSQNRGLCRDVSSVYYLFSHSVNKTSKYMKFATWSRNSSLTWS